MCVCIYIYIYIHILFHYGSLKVKMKSERKSLSCIRLFVTPWTVAYQGPPSMGFSRQECWSGLPFPSPGDFSDPGIKPQSPALQADALPSEPPVKIMVHYRILNIVLCTRTLLSILYKVV